MFLHTFPTLPCVAEAQHVVHITIATAAAAAAEMEMAVNALPSSSGTSLTRSRTTTSIVLLEHVAKSKRFVGSKTRKQVASVAVDLWNSTLKKQHGALCNYTALFSIIASYASTLLRVNLLEQMHVEEEEVVVVVVAVAVAVQVVAAATAMRIQ
jgi:hypothetical protein